MAVIAIFSWVYALNFENATIEPQVVNTGSDGQISELKRQVTELIGKNDELKLDYESLIEENTALRTLNENLKTSATEASGQTTEPAQPLDEALATIRQLESDKNNLNEKVLALTADIDNAKKRMNILVSDGSDPDEKLQALMTNLRITDTQVALLQSENSKLKDKLSTVRASPDAAAHIAQLEAENADLSLKVQALAIIQETVGENADSLKSENSDLNAKIRELAAESETGRARAAELEAILENVQGLMSKNDSLENENRNLTAALAQTEDELADANADKTYLSTRLQHASKHLRRIRKDLRMSEFESRQLAVLQEGLASNLDARETQIEQMISDYSAISLKSDVVYESGSVELNARGKAALMNVSRQLLEYTDRIVSIEGHTDSMQITARLAQTYPSNWELSSARAAEAANFLVGLGIPEERLRVVGHGPMRPIRSNDTEQGRAANRRIEIRLVPELADKEAD